MLDNKQFNQYSILNKETFEQMMRVAQLIHKLGFNKSLDSVERAFGAIQLSIEFGMPIMQFIQNVTCIMGKFALGTDLMLALVQKSKQLESITESISVIEGVLTAVCTVKRKGQAPSTRHFSIEDAKNAKLWNKPIGWQGYPQRMLQIRARGFALRDNFSDILLGLQHSTEELSEPNGEELKLVPAEEIIEYIEINDTPFSDQIIKIKFEDLVDTVINKIEFIKTSEDHEQYKIWSKTNKKIFNEFIEGNVKLDISKIYTNKVKEINKTNEVDEDDKTKEIENLEK